MVVFSLTGWSPCLPSGFLVSRRTPDSARRASAFTYGNFTLCVIPSQVFRLAFTLASRGPYPQRISTFGLGSSDFARHYFRNHCCFLFLRVLRCFSSPSSPPRTYFVRYGIARCYSYGVPSFGYLRVFGYLLLSATFRSLSRPSSAPCTKASSVSPL